ncbi:hypothetical protein [Spirosoma agri]|uniref:Uncharacterized protein n=1 Tax=Spirosoma agri TaxID=1987381 RepID=A0A6M0IR84_9BACT|nr:hypothetical protein [Spirosoma agri]NEU69975.1 hypothetical protein [Spirosoma agri]
MRTYVFIAITVALTVVLQACGSKQKTDDQTTSSTAETASVTETAPNTPVTGRLADLGLTADSHWRGINLGDAFSSVKTTEKGEPFESDAKHIGYTVEFKNLETADILYYQTNQNVSAIDVDLFLNTRQSVDAYQKELTPYFTARYGASKPASGGNIWTGPKGETITMKDVSKGKDFGLKIKIAPAGGAVTASAK